MAAFASFILSLPIVTLLSRNHLTIFAFLGNALGFLSRNIHFILNTVISFHSVLTSSARTSPSKRLMSRTIAVHVRFEPLYIS